jgi:2-dehydropantoate 2-reductase
MKICIYGAGAIGGYLGVQLALAGADVSLVARGAHLAAMKANGLKLLIDGEERVAYPRCTDNPADLGVQDVVIVCLKAHSITGVIDAMQPLLGPKTRIVTAVNGIPYWYFYKHGNACEGDAGKHRSRRAAVERTRPRTRHWLRGLSRHRDRGAGGDPSYLWRPFSIGRAVG